MTLEYKLEERDFLTYQLFIASQSERIKKRRRRSKTMFPLIYIAFAVIGLLQNKISMTLVFLVIAALWFFLYPIWERKYYIKHYLGFIRENYKDRFGKNASLQISDHFILTKDEGSESRINTSEIEKISEIPLAIYIRIKGGASFIIAKDKINDLQNLTSHLRDLANHLKINYELDEQWQWK